MMKTSYLLLILIATTLACQTKSKKEAETASTTAMVSEDSAATLAKRPAEGAPRSAADRMVRALYFEHRIKENPFQEKKDRTLVDQFFAKSTADLIWNDIQKPVGKLNRMKANPLFNAPDAAVKKAWVEPAAVAGTRAVVYVTFENKTKPEEIKIDIQRVAGRWRITDMLYPDGKRLTDLLK